MGELLGCYISATTSSKISQADRETIFENGRALRQLIHGECGIATTFKNIDDSSFGTDIRLILFEFYVNPMPEYESYFQKNYQYKKREKSVGIPIPIINSDFFNMDDKAKHEYLKHLVLQKLDGLKAFIIQKKLDTNVEKIMNVLNSEWC